MTKPLLTILLPTNNRIDYLKFTLESLQKQTYIHFIGKIIVSENGDTFESKALCEKFTDLPIEYLKQENCKLDGVQHIVKLINLSQSKYTSIIHDDDWWYPCFIEMGINTLQNNLDADCYISNYMMCSDEFLNNSRMYNSSILSSLNIKLDFLKPSIISFKDVSLLSLIFTPFHFSSFICDTQLLKYASNSGMSISKPIYADKILFPFISSKGNIMFSFMPTVGIRIHNSNDQKLIDIKIKRLHNAEGINRIVSLCNDKNINILEEFKLVFENLSEENKNIIATMIINHIDGNLFDEFDFVYLYLKNKLPKKNKNFLWYLSKMKNKMMQKVKFTFSNE